MSETSGDLAEHLQGFFGDGLLIIIGSGLSIAEGIAGMPELAEELRAKLPEQLDGDAKTSWEPIAEALAAGIGLESALHQHPVPVAATRQIVRVTGDLVRAGEAKAFADVLSGGKRLRLARLLTRCLKPESGLPIVTTNYDRLVELAAHCSGFGVDTLFSSGDIAQPSPDESRYAHCRGFRLRGKSVVPRFVPRAIVLKPHGSLDWYAASNGPIRSSIEVGLDRLLITPGSTKYQEGYRPPFDAHREAANRHIDQAARYVAVGYGFNDDHLQSHLVPKIEAGRPTLLLTKVLSDAARALAGRCPLLTCLSEADGKVGTQVLRGGEAEVLDGLAWWDLEHFAEEVLGA